MDDTPSSAAPGHFQAQVPFEVGIRRGVLLCAFALTFDWVVWTVSDLASTVLPLFDLPAVWELPGFRVGQLVLSLALLLPLGLGTVLLTRWPGPAREHATLVRVLVGVGAVVPFLLRGGTQLLSTSFESNWIVSLIQVLFLVDLLAFMAIVLFCALIVRDRGKPELGARFRVIAIIYAGYRVFTALASAAIFYLGSYFGFFSVTRVLSIVFLGVFLWLFTKTWRALV